MTTLTWRSHIGCKKEHLQHFGNKNRFPHSVFEGQQLSISIENIPCPSSQIFTDFSSKKQPKQNSTNNASSVNDTFWKVFSTSQTKIEKTHHHIQGDQPSQGGSRFFAIFLGGRKDIPHRNDDRHLWMQT